MNMRKVFLSTVGLAEMDNFSFVSDDFDLNNSNFKFAWPHIMEQYVDDEDEVLVASIVQGCNNDNLNYNTYKEEVAKALAAKNANVSFCSIPEEKSFDSRSFHKAFKEVADLIKDDDLVYLDLGNGPMPYAFSSFVACDYAIKANHSAEMGRVIYTEKDNENKRAKLYDMTGVFFLNQMAGSVRPGEKEEVDGILNMMLRD